MNRRKFLKSLFGVAALATIPVDLLNSVVSETIDVIEHDGIIVDFVKKQIRISKRSPPMSISDLYKKVSKVQWDGKPIMVKEASHIFSVTGGIKIDHDTMKLLYEGTIKQGNEVWTGGPVTYGRFYT